MTKEHVLVTGGAGYIGSILCERLLRAGFRVTALDSLLYGEASLFHLCAEPDFEFVRGDARDERVLAPLIQSADVLIPLAAVVGVGACERDPLLARSVNFEAIKLLNKMRSPEQLVIYPNTNSGYGTQTGELHCTEDTPLAPISLYGRTKVDAERLLLDGKNAITLRLATVFGTSPRMRMDLLVNHFVHVAMTDGYVVLFEKHFKRNYVHVRDVADCFAHAIAHRARMVGRPYNVGLDEANYSKDELARQIQKHIPSFVILESDLRADPDKRNYIVSNQRLREAGFEARRNLEGGIKELIKGYAMLGRARFCNV